MPQYQLILLFCSSLLASLLLGGFTAQAVKETDREAVLTFFGSWLVISALVVWHNSNWATVIFVTLPFLIGYYGYTYQIIWLKKAQEDQMRKAPTEIEI